MNRTDVVLNTAPTDEAGAVTRDVVVIGGAIAGASAAILRRRRSPGLRVLVVEKSEEFDWKVGESTVEISSYFLIRVLKLYDHLSREQLPKQGFRYWFHNEKTARARDASEVGPTQLARTPSFQLDRAVLDSHVLGMAENEGAELFRPAKVVDFSLEGENGSSVTVEKADGTKIVVRAKWVVDARGARRSSLAGAAASRPSRVTRRRPYGSATGA